MADELAAARAGLVTRLQTITGLNVATYGGAPLLSPPLAIIRQDQGPRLLAIAGNSFQARFRVALYLSHPGTEAEGWTELEKYTEQVGTKSIIAAILADRTLNAAVDFARVEPPANIGKRALDDQGEIYFGADWNVDVVKQVA